MELYTQSSLFHWVVKIGIYAIVLYFGTYVVSLFIMFCILPSITATLPPEVQKEKPLDKRLTSYMVTIMMLSSMVAYLCFIISVLFWVFHGAAKALGF